MKRSWRTAWATVALTCALLSGCSPYHGPITNAAEGEHIIGFPVGPDAR